MHAQHIALHSKWQPNASWSALFLTQQVIHSVFQAQLKALNQPCSLTCPKIEVSFWFTSPASSWLSSSQVDWARRKQNPPSADSASVIKEHSCLLLEIAWWLSVQPTPLIYRVRGYFFLTSNAVRRHCECRAMETPPLSLPGVSLWLWCAGEPE